MQITPKATRQGAKKSTGITKILKALEANGSPLPIFETNDNRDYLITTFKVHEGFNQNELPGISMYAGNSDGTMQDTMQVAMQDNMQDKRFVETLEYCTVPRTRDEVQQHLGMANRDHFRKTILKPLIDSGKLKMTIPDKPNSRNQRYVTV
jgi:predicted HTH transcriptional regulator